MPPNRSLILLYTENLRSEFFDMACADSQVLLEAIDESRVLPAASVSFENTNLNFAVAKRAAYLKPIIN